MRPSAVLQLKRRAMRDAVSRFRTCNLRVFGSALHGTDLEGSDLDLLVDPLPGATLLDLGGHPRRSVDPRRHSSQVPGSSSVGGSTRMSQNRLQDHLNHIECSISGDRLGGSQASAAEAVKRGNDTGGVQLDL